MIITCHGCGQQVTGVARTVGSNKYITCLNCGCHVRVGVAHICNTCGIKIIRDRGFVGEDCAVCEDYKNIIKEKITAIALEYNVTLDQLVNIIINTK